jgi:toxin secretion/phage lysis holin
MSSIKTSILTAFGVIGGIISSALGGFDAALTTLIILMAADYITALICAGVFKASPKTTNGGLSSAIGFKGLIKKGMVLMVVFIACNIDRLSGATFTRDGVIIAYCINESLSIIENMGLMGIYIPGPIKQAIDILKKKNDAAGGGDTVDRGRTYSTDTENKTIPK